MRCATARGRRAVETAKATTVEPLLYFGIPEPRHRARGRSGFRVRPARPE